MGEQKNSKIFRRQPILCPWITSQPYHSSLLSENRSPSQMDPSLSNQFLNNPWTNRQMPVGLTTPKDRNLPSIQQSSSQFFYFLRLMQLFPDTHPATLHTVLTLCKNDFFCAVDKLLYAKKCKILCCKRNLNQKPATRTRSSFSDCGSKNNGVKQAGKGSCPSADNFSSANVQEVDMRKTKGAPESDTLILELEADFEPEVAETIIVKVISENAAEPGPNN